MFDFEPCMPSNSSLYEIYTGATTWTNCRRVMPAYSWGKNINQLLKGSFQQKLGFD